MNTIAHAPQETQASHRALLFLFLLAGGQLIFVFGSPYFDVFPTNKNPLFSAALAAGFGLLALILWRNPALTRYAPPVYALFVAAAANLALVIGPFSRVLTATEPFRQIAQDKIAQFLTVVPVLVILSWLARRDLGQIFLQRGRPRRWLPFGMIALASFAALATAILILSGMSAAGLWAVAPYILIFASANAVMEELWFRGVFLRPFESGVGWGGAMVATAMAYGVSHMNTTYFESATGILFGLGVIGFGFILAWAMRWADSLWGSALFHMGMDLVIILPVIESLA